MFEESALFKYELAVVAILKNEALYIKEWLEYHLLAGVDHFYLYDNDSTDNVKEILKPYIDKNIVEYFPFPGKRPQMPAYNEAIQRFKFDSKYIAFIDLDEFIYPHENKSILEIANEYFNKYPEIAGFSMHWATFGSAGQEKADFSKGVLERFLYRTETGFDHNKYVKTIMNPRCVNLMVGPHNAIYYDGKVSVEENGAVVEAAGIEPIMSNRISVNHYRYKSKEEYEIKAARSDVFYLKGYHNADNWNVNDPTYNAVYDDGILKYRDSRQEINSQLGGGVKTLQSINRRRIEAMTAIFTPLVYPANLPVLNTSQNVFVGKLHTFLTCWEVNRDLKKFGLKEADFNFFEELSLKCIYKSLISGSVEIWQVQLLIDELPSILACKYPVVKDIVKVFKMFIMEMLESKRMQGDWLIYKQLGYILKILQNNEVR